MTKLGRRTAKERFANFKKHTLSQEEKVSQEEIPPPIQPLTIHLLPLKTKAQQQRHPPKIHLISATQSQKRSMPILKNLFFEFIPCSASFKSSSLLSSLQQGGRGRSLLLRHTDANKTKKKPQNIEEIHEVGICQNNEFTMANYAMSNGPTALTSTQ